MPSVNGDDLSSTAGDVPGAGEDISLETLQVRHRKYAFTFAMWVCAILYAQFLVVFWWTFWDTYRFQLFLMHKTSVALAISLLVVPSAILWGILRAVFKVPEQKRPASDLLETGERVLPQSNILSSE